MGFFKLLSGGYVGREAPKGGDREATPTGRPQQMFLKAGSVVESDKDLVALHGGEKFQYVGDRHPGDRAAAPAQRALPKPPPDNPISFPQGQVAEGFQQAVKGPGNLSEPVLESDLEQRGLIPARDQREPEQEQRQPQHAAKAKAAGDELEGMTVAELKSVARQQDIALHGATTKDEIVHTIRQTRAGR